jgi:hypothetical protein
MAGGRLLKVVKIVRSDEESSAVSATKAVFVLIHGGWHNHSAWDRVTPAMLQHETLSSALAPRLFVGDPAAIGATRINVG